MIKDKFIERNRYDERAKVIIDKLSFEENFIDGAESVDATIRAPYTFYESTLSLNLSSKSSVLELGAGTGLFTGKILSTGASVLATDISLKSLKVLEMRYKDKGRLCTQIADMESLPFSNEKFNMVTSAGALSYGDNNLVLEEIYRVLKPGGIFICVDSLDHNWLYRINRLIHYIRGKRTLSTLSRMPSLRLIEMYRNRFDSVEVKYFGSISWMAPFASFFLSKERFANISNFVDQFFMIKKSAFKFVMLAKKGSP